MEITQPAPRSQGWDLALGRSNSDTLRPICLCVPHPWPLQELLCHLICQQEQPRDVHVQSSSRGPDRGSSETLQDPRVVHGSKCVVWAPSFLLPPHCALCALCQHLQDCVVVPCISPSLTHITGEHLGVQCFDKECFSNCFVDQPLCRPVGTVYTEYVENLMGAKIYVFTELPSYWL